MQSPDIYIHEGDIYFGNKARSVSTLLGSCVAVVIWHPLLKYGGMCHVLLPDNKNMQCSNRYANCAVADMIKKIKGVKSHPGEYITHVYGGGEMFTGSGNSGASIGRKNVETIVKILKHRGFKIREKDVGGQRYQKVRLNMETGHIAAVSIALGKQD